MFRRLIYVGSIAMPRKKFIVGCLAFALLVSGTSVAQAATKLKPLQPSSQDPQTSQTVEAITVQGAAGPSRPVGRLAEGGSALLAGRATRFDAVATLAPARVADAARVADLKQWNLSHPNLYREGFTRTFDEPVRVTLDARTGAALDRRLARVEIGDEVVVTARVDVGEAYLTRLHLTDVALPKGTRLWVYGADGAAVGPFGNEIVSPERELWCPSVEGDQVFLEIHALRSALDAGAPCAVTLAGAVEIFQLDERGIPLDPPTSADGPARRDNSCLTDYSCVTATSQTDNASRAIGRMLFVSGGGSYVCTGGLLNDQANSGTPYFLTAHHCLETQSEVSSLEVWWDYRTSSCNGSRPSQVERSLGGTLLATSSTSDFTFIQLNSIPANRWLMGWTTSDPGTSTLERVSNPGGGTQVYSQTRNNPSPNGTCSSLPLSGFLYEFHVFGGTAGGSSGAPVWINNTIVVGQLLGQCGNNPSDNCDGAQSVVDGRFSVTYQSVRQWLTSPSAALPGTPTGLVANSSSSTSVSLSWVDNTTVDVVFKIERRLSSSTVFTEIATTPVNVQSFTDNTTQAQTGYVYRIRAQATSDGRFTEYSNTATVTTPSSGPLAPTSLFATKIKKKKVVLAWVDLATDESSYEVLQFNGTAYVSLGFVGANSTGVIIRGLARRTTYQFAIRACNSSGCSALAEISVTTR